MSPLENTGSPQRDDSRCAAGLKPYGSGRSRKRILAILVIAVATVLAYSNTFDASFHLDDLKNIVRNESLRDLRRLWPPSGNRWIGFLSFALNYRFGGLEVFGYHLVNLLVHVCNGLLVLWLAAITLRTPALRRAGAGPLVRGYLPLAAGLLFALHPVQTQAVTYIVQRFASLATLLFLLSLVLYSQARLLLEDPPSKRRGALLYCVAVLAAAGAMKTKEISFTLPLVAAGYELMFFPPRRRRLLLLVPLAATALLIPLELVARGENLADVLGEADIPRSVYLLTQSRVVVTYLRLFLLPVGQNLDYDFRLSHSLAEPGVLFALAILLTVAAVAVLLLRRARETNRASGALVFFGIAWFFVTLSVESSVIPIQDVIFEHRMYLPSAGSAIALGTALLWVLEQMALRVALRVQVAVVLLITAAPLGFATYARNFVWRDEISLWSDVVAKSPHNARARVSLGAAYMAKGRRDDAVREYQEAIQLDPAQPEAHNNLGTDYIAKGRLDDAMREYQLAIRLDPGLAEAHDNLGKAYQAKGQLDDAVREYQHAIRVAPGMAEAHYNFGALLLELRHPALAVEEFRRALRLRPDPATIFNLALALEGAGAYSEAIAQYERFIDEWGETFPERLEIARSRIQLLRGLRSVR